MTRGTHADIVERVRFKNAGNGSVPQRSVFLCLLPDDAACTLPCLQRTNDCAVLPCQSLRLLCGQFQYPFKLFVSRHARARSRPSRRRRRPSSSGRCCSTSLSASSSPRRPPHASCRRALLRASRPCRLRPPSPSPRPSSSRCVKAQRVRVCARAQSGGGGMGGPFE